MKTKIYILIIIIFANSNIFSQEYLAPVQNKDNLWGYINEKGELKIPYKYFYAENFSEGLAFVFENSSEYSQLHSHYINTKGEIVIDLKDMKELQKFDMWGTYMFDKQKFDFNEDLAPFEDSQKKWGFIDKTGKIVIPCQYDEVGKFSEDLAYAIIHGRMTGYIGKDGAWKIELIDDRFDNQYCFYRGEPFENGIAKMYNVDKTKYCEEYETILINKSGEIIFENANNIGTFINIDDN